MTNLTLSHYGAMGNGIDDDTYALMLSLERQGSIILEVGKTYKISSTIELHNATIQGADNAKIVYHGEGDALMHKDGLTSIFGLDLEGLHSQANAEKFGFRTDVNATGSVYISGSTIHGFTSGAKFDDGIDGCIINGLDVFDLKGSNSGEGYGLLIACSNFQVDNFSAIGDKADDNGRHGLYLSATAQNGKVSNIDIYDFKWEGLALYAKDYQRGVKNIKINTAYIRNCAHGVSHGSVSVLGNVQNVQFSNIVVRNSGGHGIWLDSYRMDLLNGITMYAPECTDSAYMGILVKGAHDCDIYAPSVGSSSLAVPQTYSNITVMTDYDTGDGFSRIADNINFYNVNSYCSANTSRSPAQVNQSTPLPTNINWYNCSWDNTNFFTGAEYI